MAVLNFASARPLDFIEAYASSGSQNTVEASLGGLGPKFRLNSATTVTTPYFSLGGWASSGGLAGNIDTATIYARAYFKYALRPTSNDEIMMAFHTNVLAKKLEIRLNSSGQLAVYDSVPTLLGTAPQVLELGQDYRIEASCGTGAAAAFELRINGKTVLTGTGNLTVSNSASVSFGKYTNRNSNKITYYFSNCLLSSTGFPGAGRCFLLLPVAAGTYSEWTGAYTDVDELPNDTTTTVISTATDAKQHTVLMSGLNGIEAIGSIVAVRPVVVIKESASKAVNSICIRFRVNATDYDSDYFNPTTNYKAASRIYETNPNTGAAWKWSDLNGLEVGCVSAALTTETVSCTSVFMCVEVQPPVDIFGETPEIP